MNRITITLFLLVMLIGLVCVQGQSLVLNTRPISLGADHPREMRWMPMNAQRLLLTPDGVLELDELFAEKQAMLQAHSFESRQKYFELKDTSVFGKTLKSQYPEGESKNADMNLLPIPIGDLDNREALTLIPTFHRDSMLRNDLYPMTLSIKF